MKGLFLVTNHTEDGETLLSRDLLIRANFKIDLVSIEDTLDLISAYNLNYKADKLLKDINLDDYDFLFISGGKYVFEVIDNKDQNRLDIISQVITYFNDKNKLIAAICAGPRFLGRLGLLDSGSFTCYRNCNHEMQGTYKEELKVVKHKNIITGRSVASVFELSYAIVETLYGKKYADDMYHQVMFC